MNPHCFRMRAGGEEGLNLFLRLYRPTREVEKGMLLLIHGMTEHSGRYDAFAREAAERGFAVLSYDQRGHGQSVNDKLEAGYMGEDGFSHCVEDVKMLVDWLKRVCPHLPLFLLGHSMGSFVLQHVIKNLGDRLDGAILSGSTVAPKVTGAGVKLATFLEKIRGPHAKSTCLNRLVVGNFNKPFRPNRTDYDWLSRSEEEVDRYLEDSACGGVQSIAYYREILKGIHTMAAHPEEIRYKDLPLLLVSGDHDPVGEMGKGVDKLCQQYLDCGMTRVEKKLYPGARHELLHESNRDEVVKDLLAWLDGEFARRETKEK